MVSDDNTYRAFNLLRSIMPCTLLRLLALYKFKCTICFVRNGNHGYSLNDVAPWAHHTVHNKPWRYIYITVEITSCMSKRKPHDSMPPQEHTSAISSMSMETRENLDTYVHRKCLSAPPCVTLHYLCLQRLNQTMVSRVLLSALLSIALLSTLLPARSLMHTTGLAVYAYGHGPSA